MSRPHYSLVTPPASEPITVAQAAEHVRVDSDADNTYLEALISVAREQADTTTGRVSVTSTWKVVAQSWAALSNGGPCDCFPLYRTPLVSVASVSYYAPDASALTVMSTDDYRVITTTEPGQIQIPGTLPDVDDRPDAIQIQFVAGYAVATPSLVPPMLRHAIKLIVAHLYEQRVPVAFANSTVIPFGLQTMLENQRVGGWFA